MLMKYTIIALVALSTVCAVSCKKKNKNDSITPTTTVDSQAYLMSNMQDVSIVNNDIYAWEMPVEWKSGKQEKVSVTITGLPANVTSSADTITGLPSFKPTFTLTAKYATPGKYAINVYASSATLGTKKYDMKLTVKPSANCASDFLGSYPATTSTRNDSTFGTYAASIGSSDPFTILITCLACKAQYTTAKATLNCDNGTFTIPQQVVTSGYDNEMKGSGQILSNGKVVLKYDYYSTSSGSAYYHVWKSYVDTLQ